MKTKNLTPFLFGAKVTSRAPPQREMTLIVRGLFALRQGEPVSPQEGPLAQGKLTAETFAEGDDERQGECLYPGDFADFKLNAEIMLRGTCYPPGGRVARECPVRFTVGAWSKAVRVVGRRVWTEALIGSAISEPAPFAKMPLGWAQSFGGPGFAQNPAGKGFNTPELPNLEAPGVPIQSKRDRPAPVGFGPINSAWPPRCDKRGKQYGKSYREKRAPFYAEDFDWTHFHAAPADQQIKGYLRGDEELSFHNLHPAASVWSARLPGLRIRAFVKDVEQRFREVRMNLDTLFADIDDGTLALTWRGLDAVKEDDLTDVATVLIASEPLGEPALPEAHYWERLLAFERDPLGIEEHIPADMRAAFEQMQKGGGWAEPEEEGAAADPLGALFAGKLGMVPPAERKTILDMLRKLSASAEGKVDLRAKIAEVMKPPEAAGPKRSSAAGDAVRALADQIEKAKAEASKHGKSPEEFAAAEQALKNPRLQRLIAVDPPPGPGADLSGRDLSGCDLAGLDLSGAKLDEAILLGASLRGARLVGASLKQVIASEVDLEGADLREADLTEAMLMKARAAGASFEGATLTRTLLGEADLTGASLAGAKGEFLLLSGARLSGARARGIAIHSGLFDGADLEGADLTEARLTSCLLSNVKAKSASFSKATLTKSSFPDADLREASFTEAKGEIVGFRGAVLDGADFRLAALPDTHFAQASAKRAKFFGADLRGATFYRASIEGADMTRANFCGANLCKAQMTGAKFVQANLYDAKLLQASGKDCDFSGANITRARFEAS